MGKNHASQYANFGSLLQLLDETENKEKSAKPFNEWIETRDENFKIRHSIPVIASYDFDSFIEFIDGRRALLSKFLESLTI